MDTIRCLFCTLKSITLKRLGSSLMVGSPLAPRIERHNAVFRLCPQYEIVTLRNPVLSSRCKQGSLPIRIGPFVHDKESSISHRASAVTQKRPYVIRFKTGQRNDLRHTKLRLGQLASVGMGNVLSKDKREQVIALGRPWLVSASDRAGDRSSSRDGWRLFGDQPG